MFSGESLTHIGLEECRDILPTLLDAVLVMETGSLLISADMPMQLLEYQHSPKPGLV